jgi:hypothetical protein
MAEDEASAQAMQIISLREIAKQLQTELAEKEEVFEFVISSVFVAKMPCRCLRPLIP